MATTPGTTPGQTKNVALSMLKPTKPYADYPLYAHASKQWAKKINQHTHYFGPWDNPQAALEHYLAQKNFLYAGQTPPAEADTVADALNAFLGSKYRGMETGELTQRTYKEYEAVCDTIVKTLGKRRSIDSLGFEDLDRLRAKLGKGVKGRQLSPVTHKRFLTITRMAFKHANDELGKTVRYAKALRMPSAKILRRVRNETGERLFSASEIKQLIEDAGPQLKAMILLGINCGFGNADCGTLPIKTLDLKNGFHNYWRPKTQVPRRCPLWPETVEALQEVVSDRDGALVFITKYGNPWTRGDTKDPISFEFRKLAIKVGIYRKEITTFYTLRRTFETISSTAEVNQAVIDSIMGHVPGSSDIGEIYRQKVFDESLRRCVDHVRDWYLGSITLE